MSRFTNSLARRRAELKNREGGFTLVELLVVVIIIGILAAIAIPIYLGIQNGAKNSEVKSDLSNAKLALVAAATADSSYTFPADGANLDPSTDTTLSENGLTKGDNVTLTIHEVGGTLDVNHFCVDGVNSETTDEFSVTADGGVEDSAC